MEASSAAGRPRRAERASLEQWSVACPLDERGPPFLRRSLQNARRIGSGDSGTVRSVTHASTRRQEALALSDQILADIELARIAPLDVARKTARLARLLDDGDAIEWLGYETAGYPPGSLNPTAALAAVRSGRVVDPAAEPVMYWSAPLGTLELEVQTAVAQLEALSAGSPASGEWAPTVELSRSSERTSLRSKAASSKSILDKVVGALHGYVLSRYQELRFGSAVETAFEVVRGEVDETIAGLVPGALPMLSAAFENAVSDNPEHWANAASTCRRLLKLIADALRPPGPPVSINGGKSIAMGDGNYINRLVDWIASQGANKTSAAMMIADLEYMGRRLDAVDSAGQKGAHDQVDRFDASRFITGTYLLLGDLLRLARLAAEAKVDPDQ